MKIDVNNPFDCCGCTACGNICPHNAIEMKPDGLGFLYPVINDNLCVECGLCAKVCQFQGKYRPIDSFEKPLVYGVRHNNELELDKSQSGAAFWAFAEYLLEQSFVVYGAGYGEEFCVKHKKVTTKRECQELRGSKYSQSDITGVYEAIKNDLLLGEKVLFTGTPCQVAGLKAYIPKRLQGNLLSIDLVCHAVPSPAIWNAYVKWIENRYNDRVIETDFRNKKFGWHSHFETFKLEHKIKEICRFTYRYFFYEHLSVRKSCSNCKFTNLNRPGDLTIGDFWGWEKFHTEWNDNKGVNLLLVNTEKGKNIFENVKNQSLLVIESNTTECLQPQLIAPIKINNNQEKFTEDFLNYGFEYVGKHYGDLSFTFQIKRIIRIPYRIVRKIYNILRK